MEIGTTLWHPCSVDIIEHKVTGILSYETETLYETKAVHNIGACGKVKVLLRQDNKGAYRFISLAGHYEHDSGLQDFVEGVYYTDHTEAKLAYYKLHRLSSWSNMHKKEELFKQAKKDYEKLLNLIKIAKG